MPRKDLDEPLTVRKWFFPGAARFRFMSTIICRDAWKVCGTVSWRIPRFYHSYDRTFIVSPDIFRANPGVMRGDGRFVLMGGSIRIGLWIQAVSGDGLGPKGSPDGASCGKHIHYRRHCICLHSTVRPRKGGQTPISLSWLYHVLLRSM